MNLKSNESIKKQIEEEDKVNAQKIIDKRNEAISKSDEETKKRHAEHEEILKEAEEHGVSDFEMMEIRKRKEAILSERRISRVINEFVENLDNEKGDN